MITSNQILSDIRATRDAVAQLEHDPRLVAGIASAAEAILAALRAGNKVLLAGNGGSAADAQHIAAEFACRLRIDRAPLAALALTADTAILTAIGNDYGYEEVFARLVRAYGKPGDVFIGITTSGRSENVLRAFGAAEGAGLTSIALCGRGGLAGVARCDHLLACPSTVTAKVQECHIVVAHILCDLVENELFGRQSLGIVA